MKFFLSSLILLVCATPLLAQPLCSCSATVAIGTPSATGASSTTVSLQWNSSFNYGFTVLYRVSGSGVGFTPNAAIIPYTSSPTKTATATGLAGGTYYDFMISGDKTCSGDNCKDNTVTRLSASSSPILTSPATPGNLKTIANGTTATSLSLSWDAVANPGEYIVDYSTDNFITLSSISSGATATTTLSSLNEATPYYIRVRASNSVSGSSANSGTLVAYTIFAPTTTLGATSIATNSFTANWAAPSKATASTRYQLDVSSSAAFTPVLKTYSNLSATSQIVSLPDIALSSGTVYYYQVRVVNEGGVSNNSGKTTLITLPGKPIIANASIITASSFQANWNASTGTVTYHLDVASDNSFTNFVAGYNDVTLDQSILSKGVSGLASGTNYYYRVKATNASGTSVYSDVSSVITISSAPISLPATQVTNSSFVANWNTSTGASSYQLTVATDNNFANPIAGFDKVVVAGMSQGVEGLSSGTTYYYHIVAVNPGGVSGNSNVISQLTLPAAPQQFQISNVTTISMKLSWQFVVSASEYDVEASHTLQFDDILPNYNPKVISSSINEVVLNEGLAPSQVYYLRMRAKNASGFSDYSETRTISTTDSGGDDTDIKLGSISSPASFIPDTNAQLSFTLDGGVGALSATFYHRKKAEEIFSSEALTPIKGTNLISIDKSWLDEWGMEFFVEAKDAASHVQHSTTNTLLNKVAHVTIPVSSFGKDISNYHIISVPFSLDTKRISDLFEPIQGLGSYDPTRWRLVKYKDGGNQDYRDGLSVSSLEPGEGYWFISKSDVTLSFGDGVTLNNSFDKPFKISLKKGWNQIGNPFVHNISWHEVLAATDNHAASVGNLLVYNNESISLAEADVLNVFEGGFVFADENTEIVFPVTLSTPPAGGRKTKPMDDLFGENASDGWFAPIQVTQGALTNTFSGIGMHPLASDGKDQWDLCTPPSIGRFTDLSSAQHNYPFNFSRSIVAEAADHKWEYQLSSDKDDAVTLSWDQSKVAKLRGQLILRDVNSSTLVNMRSQGSYTTSATASLVIYYSESGDAPGALVRLGSGYPNPFHDVITIPFDYKSGMSGSVAATVVISDMHGIEVNRTEYVGTGSGIQSIIWNGQDGEGSPVSPGLYFYRLSAISEEGTTLYTGKIIKI